VYPTYSKIPTLGLAILWFALAGRVCGAEPPSGAADYRIDCWQTEDGLPQNSVTAIAQTRDGYLWLGTFNGLARFDGVRFVVFDELTTPALRSGRIISLAVDAQGRLWILSEYGDLTVFANGVFTKGSDYCPGLPGKVGMLRGGGPVIFLTGADWSLFQIQDAKAQMLPRIETAAGGRIITVIKDEKGDFWIAQKWMLRRLSGSSVTTVESSAVQADSQARSGPPATREVCASTGTGSRCSAQYRTR
jgi:hypothetical protein